MTERESDEDFSKRVGAVCEGASGHPWYKQAQGYCGSFRTFRISAQVTDRGGMREQDAEFCTVARTALPEALERLENMETALEGMVEQHGYMQQRAHDAEAERDRLRAEVERLESEAPKTIPRSFAERWRNGA